MYYWSNLNVFFLYSCSEVKNETGVKGNSDKTVKDYSNNNKEALAYCIQNDLNTDYYFLLDYSIHPGKQRFFIYDFKTHKVIDSQLVAHGSCDVFEENPNKHSIAKFSNQNESHCSSKGKYRIGERAYSNWGINTKY